MFLVIRLWLKDDSRQDSCLGAGIKDRIKRELKERNEGREERKGRVHTWKKGGVNIDKS